MKENRIKESYNKIKLDEEIKNKMLSEILDSETTNKNSNKICIMRKEFYMKKAVIAAVVTICILALSGTAYAAYRWMSAPQIADKFDENKLSEQFEKNENEIEYAESDQYKVAYLGMVSGKNLRNGIEAKVHDTKSYIVVAVERKDGKAMTYDEDIVVSPFVKGVEPMEFNIYVAESKNSQRAIFDGVLYFITESDDLEIFADRGVYIAVMDGPNMGVGYAMDKNTGEIKRVKDYEGLNILFEANLDASKANPQAADEYLKALKNNSLQGATENSEPDEDMYNNFEGHNDLKNPEEVIKQSKVIEGSERKLTPDENGEIKYIGNGIELSTSAKIVKKNGIDTVLLYGEGDKDDIILTFYYENNEYIGRLYTCSKEITRKVENK